MFFRILALTDMGLSKLVDAVSATKYCSNSSSLIFCISQASLMALEVYVNLHNMLFVPIAHAFITLPLLFCMPFLQSIIMSICSNWHKQFTSCQVSHGARRAVGDPVAFCCSWVHSVRSLPWRRRC